MEREELVNQVIDQANKAQTMSEELARLAQDIGQMDAGQAASGGDVFVTALTVLVLAVFVGYHVVWRVTPALHSPLMAVTNAISSVIIVGALIAAGPGDIGFSQILGFVAILLASINIFGGFIVTNRMLSMFKKKDTKAKGGKA